MDSQPKKNRTLAPTLFTSIVAGSIAGATGYIATVPLDYAKQHLQSGGVAASWKTLPYRKDGFRGAFSGTILGCATIVPQMTIKFAVNDHLRRNADSGAFLNGFIAGFVDGSFLGPLLSMQSMKQMRPELSYSDAWRLARRQPLVSLSLPMAMRNSLYTSILFGGHAGLQPVKADERSFARTFLLCSALNVPATLLCSPFDVIRARQARSILEVADTPASVRSVARAVFDAHGARAFYHGYSSLLFNFGLRFPFTFALYEFLTL